MKKEIPQTIGDCTGLNSSFGMCMNLSHFPIKESIGVSSIEMDYITNINSILFNNISFLCDIDDASTGEKSWFMHLEGHGAGWSAPIKVHTWLSDTILPLYQESSTFLVEPRFRCIDDKHYTFQLDPADPDHNFELSDFSFDVL